MNENLGCRFGAISVGGRADGVRGSPCRVSVAVSSLNPRVGGLCAAGYGPPALGFRTTALTTRGRWPWVPM